MVTLSLPSSCVVLGATRLTGRVEFSAPQNQLQLTLPLFLRLQRGDGRVQEHQLHRVGCWWPGQDSAPVAALLPEHPGYEKGKGLGAQKPFAAGEVQRSFLSSCPRFLASKLWELFAFLFELEQQLEPLLLP